MAKPLSKAGVWNGWYWRYITMTVLVLAILQVIALYAFHYQILFSSQFSMIVMMWLITPRVEQRKYANTVVAIVAMFLIGIVFQLTLTKNELQTMTPSGFVIQNVTTLVIAILISYLYVRMSVWSDRKRAAIEAKKRSDKGSSTPERPQRVHHKKKKRRR